MRIFFFNAGFHLFYPLQSFWAKCFFAIENYLLVRNLCITQGFPCGFTVSVNPPVYFGWKSRTTFFFKFTYLFKIGLTRIIYLGANRGTLLLKEVGSGKMRRQRKKGEQKRSLHLFSAREKMVTDRASVADIRPWQLGQPRKQLRPPRRIEQMSFSVVCPTNFTVRRSYNYKNMYSLYVLSRNFEPASSAEWSYCWILRTIEFTYYWETKRLDLNRLSIWTTVFC